MRLFWGSAYYFFHTDFSLALGMVTLDCKVYVANNLYLFSLESSDSIPQIYTPWFLTFLHYPRTQSCSAFSSFSYHRTSEGILNWKKLSNIGQSLQTVQLGEKTVKIVHLYQPLCQEYLKISNVLIFTSHNT